MKRLLLASAFGMIASLAQAGITADQVMAMSKTAGYTNIHVTKGVDKIKVDALQNGTQVEVFYDIATGQVVDQTSRHGVLFDAAATTSGASTGTSGGGDGDDSGGESEGSDD